MNRLIFYVVTNCLVVILFLACPIMVSASSIIKIEKPEDHLLFDVELLKPGDWMDRELHIANTSTMTGSYKLISKFNGGSRKLFNALTLQLKDHETVLYEGELKDFTGLPLRYLKEREKDIIYVHISFPTHYGNDYQGLSTEFIIGFEQDQAHEESSKDHFAKRSDTINPFYSMSDSRNPKKNQNPFNPSNHRLPNTATSLFTLLLVGLAFCACGFLLHWLVHLKPNTKRSELSYKKFTR